MKRPSLSLLTKFQPDSDNFALLLRFYIKHNLGTFDELQIENIGDVVSFC